MPCFSLQCFYPSGCCERLVQVVEGMAEGTSVRTGGRVKIPVPLDLWSKDWWKDAAIGREWLVLGRMKGKCPKLGLLFLHKC